MVRQTNVIPLRVVPKLWSGSIRYSCTNSKSRDSRRELSNSRRELSISLLEFRNSRLYPIYNSQKQTRITYFSVEKTIRNCNSRRPHFSSTRELLFSWQERYTNLGKPVILVVSNSRLHENYFSLGNKETANLGVTRITFLYERKSQLFIVFHPLRHPSLAHHLLFSTGNYSILHTTQRSIQCLLISSTCSPMVLH